MADVATPLNYAATCLNLSDDGHVRLDGAFRLLLLGHGPTVPFRQRCCETSDPVLLTVLRITAYWVG